MSNIFFCADQHFHHKNILTFLKDDGSKLREFADITHMNEWLVYRHNLVVQPNDKVYFLGDVTMSRNAKGLEILARMNGEKILIKGNHDLCAPEHYLKYFKDIRAVHQFDGMVLSHVPIHTASLDRWGMNVHGHLHDGVVRMPLSQIPDHRYFCVSMERIDYTPISLEQVRAASKVR